MRSPGRSRRCKGRCSSANATGLRPGKAARGGAPSQKTCRPPRTPSNPSRKGGFVLKALSRRPRGGLFAVLAARRLAAGRSAAAHRLVVSDGNRVAVRNRRRQAGDRRRRPVRLPAATRRRPSSPATPRTSRRSPATSPTSSSSRYDPSGLVARSGALGIRVARAGRRQDARRGVRADPPARPRHGPRRRRRGRVVATMKQRIGAARRRAAPRARGLSVYHELDPTSTRRPRGRSSARSTRSSA